MLSVDLWTLHFVPSQYNFPVSWEISRIAFLQKLKKVCNTVTAYSYQNVTISILKPIPVHNLFLEILLRLMLYREFIFYVGITSERRNAEIKRLNKNYLDVIATRKGLKECLEYMVERESYRWLCKTTYSLSPKPIRSERIYEEEGEEEANKEGEEEANFVDDSVRLLFYIR